MRNGSRPDRRARQLGGCVLLLLCLLVPSRAALGGPDRLRQELDAIANRFHGTLGYSLHHLKTGDRLDRLGDEKFPTASTIKLAMLCTAMEKQQKGEIAYDEQRTFREEDRMYGSGLMQNYRAGTNVELRSLLHLMITQSDNTAAAVLGQWLGAEAVNGWLARHGFTATRLLVPWPYPGTWNDDMKARPEAWKPLQQWGMGVTTPNEMRRLIEMIADGRAGTSAACDEMHRILNHQYYDEGIASQVPPTVCVASKHGVEERSRSDVAIVHAPSGDYALAIYTKEALDTSFEPENEQASVLRAVSGAVWRYYHPRVTWSPPAGVEQFYIRPNWPGYQRTAPRVLYTPAAGKPGDLAIEPYLFKTNDGKQVDAELGRLIVPENRRRPCSNPIELAFVRFKSTAKDPGPPIVYLEGGPGGSGIAAARGAAFPALMALREIGDVIALDQRGTGMSRPGLVCSRTWGLPLDRPGNPGEIRHILKMSLRACARELAGQGIDLSGYNTEESADDVEALRKALGAEKITLWGISYGTHLGLAVIRRHGEHIDRAILTGVNGPDHEMTVLPSTVEEQLVKVDRLFKQDPTVGKLIPDFLGLAKRLLRQLEEKPVTVELPDPSTGRMARLMIGKFDLQLYLSNSVTWTWGIMNLPGVLYPMSRGDFRPLARVGLDYRTQLIGSLMPWMVTCASGASEERYRRIRREAKQTLLGDAVDCLSSGLGEALGNPDLGPAYRAPIRSSVPVLFISGTLDGRTPVSNAAEVRRGFPNSEHLIVEGASHGYDLFFFTPKVQEVMQEFLRDQPISTARVALSGFPFRPIEPQGGD
jgi:pimeloyl-ACP methyl ester carboxylesterase/beta-lactamase class A